MVRSRTRTGALRRPLAIALAASAMLIGLGQGPARATPPSVTAVRGSAFGYSANGISLFGGAQPDTVSTPTVALAADASNSPVSATAATGLVKYGPATLFTSDTNTISSAGSLGSSGSVTTSSDVQNVNYAATQPRDTGSEIFGYPPADINLNPTNLHTSVAGTATASGSGLSGLTTITNGMVRTHAQSSTDCTSLTTPCGRDGEQHTHDLNNSEGAVTIPTNPPPNYKVAGHVHLGNDTTDYYVLVFNEQTVNPDGSITVTPVHEYFANKLDSSGNLVPDGGSILHGHLYLGQVVAGVTPPAPFNRAPVATDDAYATMENTALTVAPPGVLANDTDADGDTLSAGSASGPAHGGVTLNTDGSFVYTPVANFRGTDTFTYNVSDGLGGSATGTVTITVTAGTNPVLLKDINPGPLASSPSRFVQVGDAAYFLTFDNPATNGLWKTDGTRAGTVLVKSVGTGSSTAASPLALIGGTMYFQGNDGTTGAELWKSDGTEAGTALVKDISPGSGGSSPSDFVQVGNAVYFLRARAAIS